LTEAEKGDGKECEIEDPDSWIMPSGYLLAILSIECASDEAQRLKQTFRAGGGSFIDPGAVPGDTIGKEPDED
jgi:hypothetical protein